MDALNAEGIPSPQKKKGWTDATLRKILENEKYCGDVILQKTYISDPISKKVKKNNGELPKIYIKNIGVILITTKSGKNANGVQVSYDLNLAMDRVTNLPKLQNSYGQGNAGDEWHWKNAGGGRYADMSYQDYATSYGFDYNTGVKTGYDESWGPRLDAGLKISQFDSNGEYVDWVSDKNNVKNFFRTGLSMNHVVSLQTYG